MYVIVCSHFTGSSVVVVFNYCMFFDNCTSQPRDYKEPERHILPCPRALVCSRQPCVVLNQVNRHPHHGEDVDENTFGSRNTGSSLARTANLLVDIDNF